VPEVALQDGLRHELLLGCAVLGSREAILNVEDSVDKAVIPIELLVQL